MGTVNFQMFNLDLEKAEEPEIKLPTSIGSLKRREDTRKTSTSALLTMAKPLTVWIKINWKIVKEMGIPDHLTCLLGILYAGQEATVRTGRGTMDWFPAYLIYMQGTSCEMLGWMKHKLESRLPGEISMTHICR